MLVVHVVVVFLYFEGVCGVAGCWGVFVMGVRRIVYSYIDYCRRGGCVRVVRFASYWGARRLYLTSVDLGCGVFVCSFIFFCF